MGGPNNGIISAKKSPNIINKDAGGNNMLTSKPTGANRHGLIEVTNKRANNNANAGNGKNWA